MRMSLGRSLIGTVVAVVLALTMSASALAISKPFAIGVNTIGQPTPPAVAVDPAGAAYVVWNQPSNTVLDFCKLAVGATGCSPVQLPIPNPAQALFFDPPSVLVNGADVYVFEEVNGAPKNDDGIDEWVSINGGSTFTRVPYAVGETGVGDSAGTGPQPVVALPGGNFGMSAVSAIQNPTFQANSLAPPLDYSVATEPNPYATLTPVPNNYAVPNLGGQMVSQLTGADGLLGVYEIFERGPCPSGDGLVYTYAPLSATTTNAELNTSTGGAGSPWRPLAAVSCNTTSPAVTSGASGLGLLSTNDASLTAERVQYQRFTPPSGWSAPVRVAAEAGLEPTVSQDGGGGLYATWLGGGVRLAYSGDGGSSWSGPVTLFGISNGTAPDSVNSAVGSGGQGWAVYAFDGTEYAQPFSRNDALAPVDSHLRLRPKKFTPQSNGNPIVGKSKKHHGTTVGYTDSKAAKTTFRVYLLVPGYKSGKGGCKALGAHQHRPKHSHRCTATQYEGKFSHQDAAGPNSFRFSGRVRLSGELHTLAAGPYELQATPVLPPLTGKPVTVRFTIV